MAFGYIEAVDAILSTFKVFWEAQTPAITGGPVPAVAYEATEKDLKPHPRDGTKPWARLVIRHNDNGGKATLNNSDGVARYRRFGIVWIQVFAPSTSAVNWTLGQQLAKVAQAAYEGKRAGQGKSVLFLKVNIQDRPVDGAWYTFDVKAYFYWDEVK